MSAPTCTTSAGRHPTTQTGDLYRNWGEEASLAVASVRFVAAQFSDDRELMELIGERTLRNSEFASGSAVLVMMRDTARPAARSHIVSHIVG